MKFAVYNKSPPPKLLEFTGRYTDILSNKLAGKKERKKEDYHETPKVYRDVHASHYIGLF